MSAPPAIVPSTATRSAGPLASGIALGLMPWAVAIVSSVGPEWSSSSTAALRMARTEYRPSVPPLPPTTILYWPPSLVATVSSTASAPGDGATAVPSVLPSGPTSLMVGWRPPEAGWTTMVRVWAGSTPRVSLSVSVGETITWVSVPS